MLGGLLGRRRLGGALGRRRLGGALGGVLGRRRLGGALGRGSAAGQQATLLGNQLGHALLALLELSEAKQADSTHSAIFPMAGGLATWRAGLAICWAWC